MSQYRLEELNQLDTNTKKCNMLRWLANFCVDEIFGMACMHTILRNHIILHVVYINDIENEFASN